VLVSGRTWEDEKATPVADLMIAERTLPHVIWVNSSGRRFVNEASHNCALSFTETDPSTNRPRNLPAFAIGDAQYRARYPLAGAAPDNLVPPSVVQADTLADLAAEVGIDLAGLEATVATFNHAAAQGRDPDFGRGEAAYDRALGDPTAAHPNLGVITEPPFFALPIRAGMVGTKGGPCTDTHGQVLDWGRIPIPGLFAAGNVADSVIGPGILSPGMTIGLALTWGRLAGTAAASDRRGI
jgi:3-oxosteroid 1-dehydrogenase